MLVVTVAGNPSAIPSGGCSNVGFLADMSDSMSFSSVGSKEITSWRIDTAANVGGYNAGGHFSTSTGRFTAPYSGYYFCAANVRTDAINSAYARHGLCVWDEG